nr:hypothetical protein HK105_007037 [Polyrhizophydium stewartii]
MSSRRTLAGEGRSGPASSSAGASHADRAESARGASARDAGKASSSAGQTTGVVELAALENHKENIQPLRSGHSAAALAERYADQAEPASDSRSAAAPRASGRRAGAPPASAPAPAASHSVSESRNRLEAECAQREAALARVPDTADDPLDAYVQHVRWVEQHLSTDHASYMRTLEAAMRRFRKDVRYSNDLRHLQLWIRVARRTATPIDIFKYLSVNNIGQVFALYYEEYAAMMETNQRFDEARTILQEGIAKRAQPIDRLTRLLSEFEKRRADAEAEGTAADDAGEADDGQSENGPRQPLARVSGSSRGIASKSNAWSSIDTEEQRRKENVREATKWAGATLPQKQPAVLPIEKMEVFHDEVASPTINTKAAMADIFEMFSAPLAGEDSGADADSATQRGTAADASGSAAPGTAWDDEDETISSRVYRPSADQLKIGVFRDSDDDGAYVSEAQQQQQQQHHAPPARDSTHSTPYHAARKSDALGEAGTTQRTGIGSEGMPGLDPMTPITEANSELDRTIGGLSTVRSRGTLSGASATILEEPDDTMAYRQGATSDGFGAMLGGASTSADVFNSFHFNPEDADPQSHFAILADAKDEYDDSEQPCAAQDVQGARQKARQLAARSLQVDNPCDPYTSEVRSKLLAEWQSRDDFGVTVPAFVAAQAPMPNLHEIARNKLPAEIALNHFGTLSVIGRLGNGGYGHVLLVRREMDSLQDLLEDNIEDLLNDDLDDLDEESDARTSAKASKTPGNDMFAIKIQSPPSLWEHYILSHVERRLHARARRSVVRCHSAHQFQNATCLVLDHCRYGSILDALNSDPSSTFLVDGAGFNEALAMFWTIEMLRVVESLHAARIVHGDIKADNLMLRFDSDAGRQAAILESQYHADGSGGWEHRGLVLIDWGQAIDLECFDDGQMFITPAAGNAGAAPELVARKRASLARAGRSTTAFDEAVECLEVRTGRPWRHQPDWYGIAGVAHLMLFRADMQVAAQEKDGSAGMSVHLSIKRPFKRQWQTALWSRLFDVLLNSGAYGDTVLTEVAAVRSDMQVWLEGASTKGSTMLRGLLNAVQSAAMERRRGTAR